MNPEVLRYSSNSSPIDMSKFPLFKILEIQPEIVIEQCQECLKKYLIYEESQKELGNGKSVFGSSDGFLKLRQLKITDLQESQRENKTTVEKLKHMNTEITAYRARHEVNWVQINGEIASDFNPAVYPLEHQIWLLDRQKNSSIIKYANCLIREREVGISSTEEKENLKVKIYKNIYQQMFLYLKMSEMDYRQKLIIFQQLKALEPYLTEQARIELKKQVLDPKLDRIRLEQINGEKDTARQEQAIDEYLEEQKKMIENDKECTGIFKRYIIKLGEQACANQFLSILVEKEEKQQKKSEMEALLKQKTQKNEDVEETRMKYNIARAEYESINDMIAVRGLIQQDYNESIVRSNMMNLKVTEHTSFNRIPYELILNFPSDLLLSSFYQTYLFHATSIMDGKEEALDLIRKHQTQLYTVTNGMEIGTPSSKRRKA